MAGLFYSQARQMLVPGSYSQFFMKLYLGLE